MKRIISIALVLMGVCTAANAQTVPGNCGLQLGGPVIFCDTFDNKNPGIQSRTGDLDPNVWGVSRATGDVENSWASSIDIVGCNGTVTVSPPHDVIICNGQLRQAVNDNHNVTVLAMYPKQPFDFAGRTGTVSFDVSNDTQGTHAAWPEFWITDTPVPAPFSHFDTWLSFPKNGLGVRMALNGEIGQQGGCSNGNNLDKRRWSIDSAIAIRNYVYEDTQGYGTQSGMHVNVIDCVIASPGPNGPLNHVEMRVAQNMIEVWASDAGSSVLRKIATVTNPNLSFSRGLVWIQDGHYNAAKGACPPQTNNNAICQTQHTFTWDNVAFDGPFTYRDFSYDALDGTAIHGDGNIELGKDSQQNQYSTWNVLNMPANPQAAAVRVLFNWRTYFGGLPTNINVKVNGHPHVIPYPYPIDPNSTTTTTTSWRTLPVTIPLSELVAGTNVVEVGTDAQQLTTVANVNIVLVDVPGGVPVLPGSNNTYPAGGASAVNGVCGSANGTTVPTAPTSNLCTVGLTSSVSGTGPWSWACAGSNGGTTAICSANKTAVSPPAGTFVPSANCSLTTPAFCDTFNQGPSAIRGRGGDLDPAKWATARLSGEILSSGLNTANPTPIASIPQCRAGITQTFVYPPNDTLICDPIGTKSSQLMTAVSIQNYGVNSYMPRQPFDFAGRTGKIVFDVDAITYGGNGFIEIEVTDEPWPATTFREFQNYEVGPVPKNGISLKFLNVCNTPTSVAPVSSMVYSNYVGTIITPTFDHANGCAAVSQDSLNHFEVQVSQSHIDVYGSDFSTDNGQTFPNYKLLYSANINLPFSRGHVHFNPRNHATAKYGFGPDAVFHWDNIGFDGPVIPAPRAYEIPDNTTMVSHDGAQHQNLGWWLLDQNRGVTPGIYNPTNRINSLAFQNINIAGITSATLTLNAFFNNAGSANMSWGISYRFNGGAWRNRNLTAGDLASINTIPGSPLGILSMLISVPITDLIQGTNALELLPLNAPMDYPPVVSNIDLLLDVSGVAPPSPTVVLSASPASIMSGQSSMLTWSSINATSCVASDGWMGSRAVNGSLVVTPTSNSTYTLACSGSGGSASANTTVAVSAPPPTRTCTIMIPPFTFPQGGSTQFSGTANCQ